MGLQGWIGVDLDGTLADYSDWKGPEHIGPPVEIMVSRVKKWLEQGLDVRIFTARVNGNGDAAAPIESWCETHIGQKLPITCMKDYGMVQLWDDRCVQIIPNSGLRADGEE